MLVSAISLILTIRIAIVTCQGSLSADQATEQNLTQALLNSYNQNVKPDVNKNFN
jgi:hypothetical protein